MNKFFTLLSIIILSCKPMVNLSEPSFELLYQSEYGGNKFENLTIIDSKSACINMLENVSIEEKTKENILKTDFKNYSIAFISMGQKNNGGFSINVKSIKLINEVLFLQKQIKEPKPLEPVTMALTNPYCLVKVSKHKEYKLK